MGDFAYLTLCLASHPPVTPDTLWASWSLAPQVTIPLAALLAIYALGWRRSGGVESPIARRRIACFAAGWLVLVAALVSPLCRLSATLVSAHMLQHVLIVAVAPALLAVGDFGRVAAAALRLRGRWRADAAITICYGAAIWLWHFPPVYTLVLLDATAHVAAYGVLIAASVAFWTFVVRAARDGEGFRAVAALFVTLVHTGVLGALLTFSPRPWYPVLAGGAEAWGLSALSDQHLAGLIMWIPMGFIYLGAALAVFGRQLADPRAAPLHG